MRVVRRQREVLVAAPAKINLFFEIVSKRPDGFHEIETLMWPVAIYDELRLRDRPHDETGPVRLACRWAGATWKADPTPRRQSMSDADSLHSGTDAEGVLLPREDENLAVRAVRLLRQRSGCERACDIVLTKRIPMAAGMGGGSSDAAAALVAANMAWDLGWSRGRLATLAAEIGSDVPFFLSAGPAICRGRGERIEPQTGLGILHLAVVKPPAGLSTAEVYAHCRPSEFRRRVEPLTAALRRGDMRQLGSLVYNALQPAACKLSAWIRRLEREFAGMDCLAFQMSGSGTSFFGVCRTARHAERVAARLRTRGIGRVVAASTA